MMDETSHLIPSNGRKREFDDFRLEQEREKKAEREKTHGPVMKRDTKESTTK